MWLFINIKSGLGIGLQISKKITGIIGPKEEIQINSVAGVGSSFRFLAYIDIIQVWNEKDDENYN